MFKILVCGGRNFNDKDFLFQSLDDFVETLRGSVIPMADPPKIRIISGGARGADTLAAIYARERGCGLKIYPAEWGLWGNAAGPIRNQRMLEEENPDVVFAFRGGKGTFDMISKSKRQGFKVIECS